MSFTYSLTRHYAMIQSHATGPIGGRGGLMPEHASQTIRRRRLAAELRRLREQTGLTGDEAADRLGWSASKISRIETHRIGVKPGDLRRLLDLYQVEAAYRDDLQALARESTQPSRVETAAARLPDYTDYVSAEQEARTIWFWNPVVVPGLLQTEEYAAAVIAGHQAMFRLPPADANRRIELRRMRQEVLTRDPPLELSVVLDESVLYRKYGDRGVMHQQLLRLAEMSQLPTVRVRVLALGDSHTLVTGAFSYLEFPPVHDVPMKDIVALEHLTGTYYLDDEEQTYQYRVSFESLIERSLDAAQSRDAIRTAADRWV